MLDKLLHTERLDNPELIRQALELARLAGYDRATPSGKSCLVQGLEMAEILSGLYVDSNTLAAALLYSSVQYAELPITDIVEHVGIKVAKLITGVKRMAGISELYRAIVGREQYQNNIANIRKMLLAMVEDIRIVLIKLAEQLYLLRAATMCQDAVKRSLATETMAIYAPLANRLGIAEIKWELEDLAFQYLEPQKYQEIVAALNQNFPARASYLELVIAKLQRILHQDCEVVGRIKHVFSIYRKMCRKQVGIDKIFDVTAVRILVTSIAECYTVLSQVHAMWQHIPEEFDDYIVAPKANNYRSIHTAVRGPEGKIVEIQIRTYEMHQHAELGIAAHWIYKEDGHANDYDTKIAWLRQVMDWQREITSDERTLDEVRQMFNDQVYVFTPEGDIIDLVQGATPLDFAYRVHSEIGHSCCGAKVNGNIVPLTHVLQTGERVTILTTKHGHPSRDWLNPSLGYLKTTTARAKVYHWFKKQGAEHNLAQGQALFDKEVKRLNLKKLTVADIAEKLHFKTSNDFLVALGRGEVKLSSILEPKVKVAKVFKPKEVGAQEVSIPGVANVLTRIANCCKPKPGEPIIGYITQGRGIAVHRTDCLNVLCAMKHHPEKVVVVNWSHKEVTKYPVTLQIQAYRRSGLVHDITAVLKDAKLMLANFELQQEREALVTIIMTIEMEEPQSLSNILTKISYVPNVIEVIKIDK